MTHSKQAPADRSRCELRRRRRGGHQRLVGLARCERPIRVLRHRLGGVEAGFHRKPPECDEVVSYYRRRRARVSCSYPI